MIVSMKLHIPQSPTSLVQRPELMHKFHEGMKSKLTIISAQAGYGKTTALSEWVKQCGTRVAWVSLDKQDNDWILFWSYVTASIGGQVPGFGDKVRSQLAKGSSVSWEPVMSALLNELNDLYSELVIILDDYHFIELPTIHKSLAYFLEHLPPCIHLFIASRSALAIPTARLLAKGELQTINMLDLQFQLEDGVAFFRDSTHLPLTVAQVSELIYRTEGWISGLKLAAISLQHSRNIADTLLQFGGQHQHIADYLLEEVFYHQSESMRSFLLQTSILNRMNHSLCEAVTGGKDSQERLEMLEKLNLFIIPLDNQRKWYRYHYLLSDFLQTMLVRTDSSKREQAHRNAANWLEHHGFDEEAVEHYIEGKYYTAAVRLIEKNLLTLVQSKSVVLIRWLSAIPESSFAKKPMIELFYSAVLLGVGEWKAAFKRIELAEFRFHTMKNQLPIEQWKQAMGNVYFFRAVTAYLQKDLQRTSAYFELVEQYMPEGSFFQTMGRNRYQGYDAFDDLLSYINDLHAADEFLASWIKVWECKEQYPFVGYLYASYSQLLYEWNQLDAAALHANEGMERMDVWSYARIIIRIVLSASRIQQASGHSRQASELLDQLKVKLNSPDNDHFMIEIEAEQASLSLRQGCVNHALEWVQNCELSHTDELSLKRSAEYLVLARVLAATERMDEALYLLERLYHLFNEEACLRDRIKVVILKSLTLHRLGRIGEAISTLELALQLGEPQGYIRSFIDEGEPMAELLILYTNASAIVPDREISLLFSGYARKLLESFDMKADGNKHMIDRLTKQEKRVLDLIVKGMSNKEISNQLHVAGETVKSHIKNIYRKLGVSNRIQALQRANEYS